MRSGGHIRIFFLNDVPNWKRYRGLILMLIHIITRYRPNVDLQLILEKSTLAHTFIINYNQ